MFGVRVVVCTQFRFIVLLQAWNPRDSRRWRLHTLGLTRGNPCERRSQGERQHEFRGELAAKRGDRPWRLLEFRFVAHHGFLLLDTETAMTQCIVDPVHPLLLMLPAFLKEGYSACLPASGVDLDGP